MIKRKPYRRPTTATLRRVFRWLERHEMAVYGPCIDADTGIQYASLRDYDVTDAVKVARLMELGKITDGNPNDD